MKKVLFVCVHNSARSQMAEAFLKHYGSVYFEVESAGLEPGVLNELAVEVMQKEEKIDISKNETNSVFEFYKSGKQYNYVITLCDETNSEKCPTFPSASNRLHWSFKDPSNFIGDKDKKYEMINELKDDIKIKILEFIAKNKLQN